HIRYLKNFYRLEGGQIYSGNPRGIVSVDEQPPSVKLSVLLGKFYVMGVVPRHKTIGSIQHGLGLFAVAIPVLRVLRKDGDLLEHSARRDTINRDLPTVST